MYDGHEKEIIDENVYNGGRMKTVGFLRALDCVHVEGKVYYEEYKSSFACIRRSTHDFSVQLVPLSLI